ncbi:hypothetical protein [Pseudomonas sp. UMAB-40]|uniref:hypothetical protein n=1 Tax=Pseudomonas sp. UMAB-40 TaxID=1365407 RepID=UPI001C588067|nr:hypothetical protein [Pseudomonas sp. UMAB-40]
MHNFNHSQQDAFDALTSLVGSLNRFRAAALVQGAVSQGMLFDDLGAPIEGDCAELLISAICKWDVAEDSECGNVLRYPGLFEVSPELLHAIYDLNTCKQTLEEKASSLEATNSRDRQNKLREILRKQGLAKAHPLQCWRTIHVIEQEKIKTVGFSTINKSIGTEVLTKDEALARLRRRNAQDVVEQLEAETCLSVRWVTPVSPFVRANVSFWQDEALTNTTYHASLPLIVKQGAWPKKVKFNLPREVPATRKVSPHSTTINLPFRENAYLALS